MKPDSLKNETEPRTYQRAYVMLRAHIGPLGNVLEVNVRVSSGNAEFDLMAINEVRATPFPIPRKGHKASAQWRNLRWDVPEHLR
jgi:TonB family protein